MIYFTSDLHFHHEKIIKHVKRSFYSVEEMNQKLMANWNRKVEKKDEIYILGDFTIKGGKAANEILRKLNGRKYLIKGNHDNFIEDKEFNQELLEWIKEYYELNYKNWRFILFHYPIEEWNKKKHGSIHLHGHLHSDLSYNIENIERRIRKMDVGIDANCYHPVGIDEVIGACGFF